MTRVAGLLALTLLVAPNRGLAQARLTTADLEGAVKDETGAILPGAKLTVTNLATGVTRRGFTDSKGRYFFPALALGAYRIGAELPGFVTEVREGAELALGQTVRIDLVMKLSAWGETVHVVAPRPAVDVTRTAISSIVTEEQIRELPINGRNFIGFSVLAPGVTGDRLPPQGASTTSGLSFTAQRGRSNNIMVDGLDNNDGDIGAVRAVFSQEAVREFQVLTSSYSAEFGRASGGVVNIVTRGGTNAFHGGVFWYFRDDSLAARNYFERFDTFGDPVDAPKAPFRSHQYGATLGGPLRRDRTFFFLSAERAALRAANVVTIDATVAALLTQRGFPVETGAVAYDYETLALLGRIDHHWGIGSSLALRLNYSDVLNQNLEPFGGIIARSRGAEELRHEWSLAASQTNLFGKWLNEARVLLSRMDRKVLSLDPACDGPCDGDMEGGPTVEIVGVASVGRQRFTPRPRLDDRIQITETISGSGGSHLWKAGVDLSAIRSAQSIPVHFGGRFIFAGLPAVPNLGATPVSAVQAFALGLPASYVQGYGNPARSYTFADLSAFVQDEWRLTRGLTLKAGLRYQRQFWPNLSYEVSDVRGESIRYELPPDRNNFAPRIGVSFSPRGDARTTLRAAYGVFFESHITAIAGLSDTVDGGFDGVRTRVAALPESAAAWRAPGRRLPEPAKAYPSLQVAIDPRLQNPLAHQAAVGVDRALGRDLSFSVDFVYLRGKGQLGTIDYNPRLPALGHPQRRPNDEGGVPGTSASVLQYTGFGESWYRGLTVSLSKRFSGRSQFVLAYTLSRAEDNSTDFHGAFIPETNGRGRNADDRYGLPVGFDPGLEKGPAVQDQRHRLVLSGFYRFPHDLQLSAILTAASGRPFTPLAGFDWNGDGDGGAFPSDRARRSPSDVPSDPTDSVGRNCETMATHFIIDARLGKQFRVGKRATIQAIVEAFNLLDRANYTEINNIFGSGSYPEEPQRDAQGRVTYGLYQQALPPRQIQLALRVGF